MPPSRGEPDRGTRSKDLVARRRRDRLASELRANIGKRKTQARARDRGKTEAMDITVALNRYDRHVPFFNGTVPLPEGLAIRPLEIGESALNRDGTDRHERGLNHLE